jgi:hypothetical protein
MGRMENRLKGWSRPLKEAVGSYLSPVQMSSLETSCRWTAEGVWAILQEIEVVGAKLNSKVGTLWNALTVAEKGQRWLGTGPRLREAGWFELPEDTTPLEAPGRRLAAGRLAPYRRLPLDESGQIHRGDLQRQVAEKRQLEQAQTKAAEPVTESKTQAQEIWDRVLQSMMEVVPEASFKEWVKPCSPVAFDEVFLTVKTPSPAAKMWVEQQLEDEFKEGLDLAGLGYLRLQFI